MLSLQFKMDRVQNLGNSKSILSSILSLPFYLFTALSHSSMQSNNDEGTHATNNYAFANGYEPVCHLHEMLTTLHVMTFGSILISHKFSRSNKDKMEKNWIERQNAFSVLYRRKLYKDMHTKSCFISSDFAQDISPSLDISISISLSISPTLVVSECVYVCVCFWSNSLL